MLTAPQLPRYFPICATRASPRGLALVHSRFSTNTFPSWELAHPYRMVAHNGEVNTLRGNVNWMRARESQLASDLFGDDLDKVIPVVREGGSDSAVFDNVLEMLVLKRPLAAAHAVMMMVPEAYRTRTDLDPDVRGFYAFHSCLMEPWDGPAAIVFTDGRLAGRGAWTETACGPAAGSRTPRASWSWPPRPAWSRSPPSTCSARAGWPRARCSCSTSRRADRPGRGDQAAGRAAQALRRVVRAIAGPYR